MDRSHERNVSILQYRNETKINLEKERMMETKESFIRWKMEKDYESQRVKNTIEKESNQRKKHINAKINNREQMLHSLKG